MTTGAGEIARGKTCNVPHGIRAGCFAWTIERIDELRRRWSEGESAFLIAESFGITRSAIIGKVHRLKLPQRATTIAKIPVAGKRWNPARWERERRKPVPKRSLSVRAHTLASGTERMKVQRTVPVVVLPHVEPPSLNLSLYELTEATCRWPHGNAAPFSFCGHDTYYGSYCAYHQHRSTSKSVHPLLEAAG